MASACKKRLIATLFAALEAVLTMDGASASRAARQPHFKSLVQQGMKRHDLLQRLLRANCFGSICRRRDHEIFQVLARGRNGGSRDSDVQRRCKRVGRRALDYHLGRDSSAAMGGGAPGTF